MIDIERLSFILRDCLFVDEQEYTSEASHLHAQGVVQDFEFHAGRYKQHEPEIVSMIDELQDILFEPGGASFLAMPTDKNGDQWGEHEHCEMLLALAVAGDHAQYVFGRDQWKNLLGGMPLVRFSRPTTAVPPEVLQ